MEGLARKYWKDKDKIAKLTSYGSYLDCQYITAKYPDDDSHIVGDLAEYVYDLEQKIEEQCEEIEKLTKSFAQKNNEDLSTTINGVKFTNEQIIALQQVGYSAEYDKNQTAITELEKAKEFCVQREKDFTYLRDEIKCIDHNKWVDYIEELRFIKSQIDQQIKSLKGGKTV